MNIAGFEKIAPYLTHPLVLVGFVLMLAYGIHWQLMKSGLLAQATKKDSALIIRLFLRYGFWLALILLLAGFGLQFSGIGLSAWNSYMDKEKVVAVNAGKVAEQLYAQLGTKDKQLESQEEQIKALTEAVTALARADAPAKSVNDALRALEQGDTKQAQAIFADVLNSKEAEGRKVNKEAAAAARHLGALAYMNDIKVALAAYRKVVKLDPDNAEDWNRLGHLFHRTGQIKEAEKAYRRVLALGEAHKDKEEQAAAYGNLGIVYRALGDLSQTEQLHEKALKVYKDLGSKEGMANQYSGLGLVYTERGELNKAKEMHREALAIHEDLDSREGMAQDYNNLGLVYYAHDELVHAEEMYSKAMTIYKALGSREGVAAEYGNLGLVYAGFGELDKAEEMYRKSLKLCELLGLKETMAEQYDNLGCLYQVHSEFGKAEQMFKISLQLFQEMNHPNAMREQQWLDKLARHKTGNSQ